MTLWVSGIPKWTCKPRNIKHLFNSVAQVRCVEVNQDQGFAKVKLFDEDSSSLVADKEWSINGSQLYVTTNQFSMRREKRRLDDRTLITSQKHAEKRNSDSHYQIYKSNANSFWLDVPHHKAKMKRKGQPKSKHKMQIPKKGSNTDYMVDRTKEEKLRNRKRRKLPKDNKCLPNNPTSLKLDEFIAHVDNVMKEICQLEKYDKTNNSKKDVMHKRKYDCSKEISTNEACSYTVHCPVNLETTSVLLPEIPACVYFQGKMTVINVCSVSSSEDEIKEKVRVNFGVPAKLQLLLCNGKVFGPDCLHRLRPYDNIYVIIRGKGGMRSSQLDISDSSSETDVNDWLKKEVGLNDEILEQYSSILSELNGQTLFSYDIANIDSFISDTDIPIGIARKILAYRDKTFDGISNPLLRLTSEKISEFVKRTLKSEDKVVEQLTKEIIERHIDGYVFYSYKDEKQFQHDFADLNLKGMYFKKIILKRNSDFEIQSSNKYQSTSAVSEDQIISDLASSQPIQKPGTQYVSDSRKYLAPEPISRTSENPHRLLVCSLLSLNEIQIGKDSCQIKIIYGSKKDADELGEKFVFFLICQENEYRTGDQKHGLWKLIKNNMELWLTLLPQDKRKMLEKVQLSNQCKFAYVMEKDCKSIKRGVPIVLVSKSILQSDDNSYVAKLTANRKNPETFHFSFKPYEEYFTFNPENYDEGFIKEILNHGLRHTDSLGDIEDKDATVSNTVEKLPSKKTLDMKEEKNIKQKALSFSNNERVDASKTQKDANSENDQIENELPRNFMKNSEQMFYHKGGILPPEHDGTLSSRSIEYKAFFNCVKNAKENKFSKFQSEVLRYACGCLNARRNGTIYFGVADSVHPIDGERYRHGEVVGFEISEIGNDSRAKYTDVLRDGINICFHNDVKCIAAKCISNPVFVRVIDPNEKKIRYVMEVDIEPSSSICSDNHFRVNLQKIPNPDKSVKNEYLLYIRRGSSTEKLKNDAEQLFINKELRVNISERQDFEQNRMLKSGDQGELSADKLERLLTRQTLKFDKQFWPILVLSKPSEEQKKSKRWIESLYFIKTIHFAAVFDFDNFSNKDGLCFEYRNPEKSELCTEEKFHEKFGNLEDLMKEFAIPHQPKTVWILSNGKEEEKLHYSRHEWHKFYSAAVCDAVSFFNQPLVIPKGRAVIVVLLFSDDHDGLIDTFNEITKKFGWSPIVIVCEEKGIFDNFCKTIQLEGKGSKKDLEDVSVIGMPWEHVNSTINSLTGNNERGECVVPCSSGALVNADAKFIDVLADLSILSAKQCETLKTENSQRSKQLAREHEMKFYKGQKVTWWNFYFGNQVCLRHKYETLNQRAHYLLREASREKSKVVHLIIAHEPGAGATTVGHQLLWDLRLKYKCCVIQNISKMTTMNILSLWKYGEKENETQLRPIVVLLDDIVRAEISISEFTRQLNIEFKEEKIIGMNCLVVICQREETLNNNPESKNIFYVRQNLSEDEKKWFTSKYEELEQIGRELGLEEYKPQNLISFAIMRSEFNPEYIKSTVKHLISTVDILSPEYKLIKYVSFLATYTPFKRRGGAAFVPLECCDELMGARGNTLFWERRMSNSVKALLVIEDKEEASGKKVRIAHSSLCEVIFNEILLRENTQLSDIAKEYLNCSLLHNKTYGSKYIIEFTLDMLKRRKKEEEDNEKKGKFSPLIEEIIGNPKKNEIKGKLKKSDIKGNPHDYDKAAEILQLGFKYFKDSMLAQALARLYLRWPTPMYDEAIKWAENAVDMSVPSTLPYIRHTHGFILKTMFKDLTLKKFFNPSNVSEHLKLILKSLDVFLQAAADSESDKEYVQNLVCLYDAFSTINTITNFLRNNVMYGMDHENVFRYLKDDAYVLPEISDTWAHFHQRLKKLQKDAYYAINELEENVCFLTTFYASDVVEQDTSNKSKEPQFYANFHKGYEHEFNRFSEVYGESDIETDAPNGGPSQITKDTYHRRRLLTLKGNSYMTIFSILMPSHDRSISAKLREIKEHTEKIEAKDSNDLLNQVCVNIALGTIGFPNVEPERKLLKLCQKIITHNLQGKVRLAHFFITMLLWPCDTSKKAFYDDSLLKDSLFYLDEKFRQFNYKNQTGQERIRFKPTSQFFLTKEKGLKSLCHRCQVPGFFRENRGLEFKHDLWNKSEVKEKLRRLHGTISDDCRNILFKHEHGQPIKIKKIRWKSEEINSEKEVSFYLGFSIAGPIAYNVLESQKHQETQTSHHESNT